METITNIFANQKELNNVEIEMNIIFNILQKPFAPKLIYKFNKFLIKNLQLGTQRQSQEQPRQLCIKKGERWILSDY